MYPGANNFLTPLLLDAFVNFSYTFTSLAEIPFDRVSPKVLNLR